MAVELLINAPVNPITANLAQIKEYVSGVVAKYQAITYTEDQVKQAKADRAELRHLKEDIEVKRKAVKAAWNKPYLAFESDLKKITDLIDEPVALIDMQVKEFEAVKRAKRVADLQAIFDKWNKMGPLLSFDALLTDEMKKFSISDAKATRLLIDKMEQVQNEVAQLESVLEPDFRTECLTAYFEHLNLTDAIAKQTLLRVKREQQNAILGTAEPVAPVQEKPQPAAKAAEVEEDIFAGIPLKESEAPEMRHFVITGTPEQVDQLQRLARGMGVTMREIL